MVLNVKVPPKQTLSSKADWKNMRPSQNTCINEAFWIYMIPREVSKGRSARQAYFFWLISSGEAA